MKLKELKEAITTLVNGIEKPHTNDPELQKRCYDFAIFSTLSDLAKKYEKAKDALKKDKEDLLKTQTDAFILYEIPEVKVMAKVSNPRTSFDKDEFIRAVSDQYNISAFELHEIAANCEKKSAAPVTLTCEIINVPV